MNGSSILVFVLFIFLFRNCQSLNELRVGTYDLGTGYFDHFSFFMIAICIMRTIALTRHSQMSFFLFKCCKVNKKVIKKYMKQFFHYIVK